MKIALTVKERLNFEKILPHEHSLEGLTRIADIKKQIVFTKDELTKINFETTPLPGQPDKVFQTWKSEIDLNFKLDIDNEQIKLLQKSINTLSKAEKIPEEIHDLCIKIKNIEIKK